MYQGSGSETVFSDLQPCSAAHSTVTPRHTYGGVDHGGIGRCTFDFSKLILGFLELVCVHDIPAGLNIRQRVDYFTGRRRKLGRAQEPVCCIC